MQFFAELKMLFDESKKTNDEVKYEEKADTIDFNNQLKYEVNALYQPQETILVSHDELSAPKDQNRQFFTVINLTNDVIHKLSLPQDENVQISDELEINTKTSSAETLESQTRNLDVSNSETNAIQSENVCGKLKLTQNQDGKRRITISMTN